jgi:16S rRNA (cytosine1407-C5)-methyltransferase
LLKITSTELQALFEEQGYTLEPIPWCDEGFWINETRKALPENLGNWLPHLQGQFYIQEASSMLPVKALLHQLDLYENANLLDMAAAPGSKTTQLASLLDNHGLIVANELSSSRLKGLHYNIQRCGVYNSCLSHADGRQFGELTPQQFDAILLDAPCGGEGTVRKDDSALANWDITNVESMAKLQKELIISAYKALKPGGRLVYSTCTLSQEENQQVCQFLLDEFPDSITVRPLNDLFSAADKTVTEEGYLHVFPQTFDCEGFFVACFEKSTLTPATPAEPVQSNKSNKFHFSRLSQKNLKSLTEYSAIFGWDITAIQDQLWHKSNKSKTEEIWYLPQGAQQLSQKIRLNRYGIKLFELSKHGAKIQHQAVTAFGHCFEKQTIELNAQQATEYYQGKDIYLDNIDSDSTYLNSKNNPRAHKELIATYKGIALGLVKHLGNKLKNNLPRDLVRDGAF